MDVAYTSNEKPVNITPQLPKMQKMVYNIILNNPGIKRPSICKIAEITDGNEKSIIHGIVKKTAYPFHRITSYNKIITISVTKSK